jgi:hypothetical protein
MAVRGGSWNNKPRNVRAANRNRNTADNRNNNQGLRLAQDTRRVRAMPTLVPARAAPFMECAGVPTGIHGSGSRASHGWECQIALPGTTGGGAGRCAEGPAAILMTGTDQR